MTEKKKRIAVIGGGLSGIGSIPVLKAEGLEPVCFEATDAPGGTWVYREESVIGHASIMPTTYLNNSKEISAFSMLPPKKEYSVFMRHSEAYQYYMEVYKHFDCGRHITFNTEVIKVTKSEDYEATGRFVVTTRDKISGEVNTGIFDGVIVGTGHFTIPKMEKFPGLEKFKGKVMHTHSLKGAEKFKGQNVLVVGSGCSALDAADATSEVANQVYLSTRSGMFVISRVAPGGFPFDYMWLRRYMVELMKYLPKIFISWYVETFYLDVKFDHNLYAVEPNYHMLSKDPIINDAIFSKLLSGSVVQKGQIKYFTENGVVFDGEEESITEIDTVILATGYTYSHPFLEKGLLQVENERINLYKCMYPIQLPHASLVFIGFLNPFGPGVPLGEMQLRWAAHMFAGKGKLPSKEVMLKDVIKRDEENRRCNTPSEFNSVRVQFMEYIDDIASQIGVRPNILKYFFTDFPLFLKLVFGPVLPYHYRLDGPHKWEGAREAIMTCYDRLIWPLTRENRCDKGLFQLILEFIGNLIPRNIFLY